MAEAASLSLSAKFQLYGACVYLPCVFIAMCFTLFQIKRRLTGLRLRGSKSEDNAIYLYLVATVSHLVLIICFTWILVVLSSKPKLRTVVVLPSGKKERALDYGSPTYFLHDINTSLALLWLNMYTRLLIQASSGRAVVKRSVEERRKEFLADILMAMLFVLAPQLIVRAWGNICCATYINTSYICVLGICSGAMFLRSVKDIEQVSDQANRGNGVKYRELKLLAYFIIGLCGVAYLTAQSFIAFLHSSDYARDWFILIAGGGEILLLFIWICFEHTKNTKLLNNSPSTSVITRRLSGAKSSSPVLENKSSLAFKSKLVLSKATSIMIDVKPSVETTEAIDMISLIRPSSEKI